MANKFIVFVVFAAVAQASLASATESSIVEKARERSRISWRAVGDTICKVVRNQSWSIEAAKEEFQQHVVDARSAFLEVAPYGDRQDLQDEVLAVASAFRKGVFQALEDARTLTSCVTTVAGIEEIRRSLPYKKLAESYQKFTTNTGPTLKAQTMITYLYQTLFAEIEKLAYVTCGRQESLGVCDSEVIYSATDATVDTIFDWIEE